MRFTRKKLSPADWATTAIVKENWICGLNRIHFRVENLFKTCYQGALNKGNASNRSPTAVESVPEPYGWKWECQNSGSGLKRALADLLKDAISKSIIKLNFGQRPKFDAILAPSFQQLSIVRILAQQGVDRAAVRSIQLTVKVSRQPLLNPEICIEFIHCRRRI